MSATLGATLAAVAPQPQSPPLVALLVADPSQRRRLEALLRIGSFEEADVLVVMPDGAQLPVAAAGFEGPLVVLSDAPALAADRVLAGVLPRAAASAQVAAAVAAVAAGLVVRTPTPAPETAGFAPPEAARPLLTPREVEVLTAVGQGMSNKAIARRLGISAHTVKYYLESIFQKLDVRSRAEAVATGLRLGVQVL